MKKVSLIVGSILLGLSWSLHAQDADGEQAVEEGLLAEPVQDTADGSIFEDEAPVAETDAGTEARAGRNTRYGYIGVPLPEAEGANTSRVANEFVDLMAASEYNIAFEKFDTAMKKRLPPRYLRKTWLSLVRKAGDYHDKEDDWVSTADVYQVAHVPVKFGDTQVVIRVVVNGDEVTGLYFDRPFEDKQ